MLEKGTHALGRRTILRSLPPAALAVAGGSVLAPRPARAAMGYDETRHLLGRTGFGTTGEEIDAYRALDRAAAVDRLLSKFRTTALAPAPSWIGLSPTDIREQGKARGARDEERKPGRKTAPSDTPDAGRRQDRVRDLVGWWLTEMLTTDQPFVERMTFFWHGHFTSSVLKVRYTPALYRQNLLFRQHALGNFASLLRELARDPAMLFYLDGDHNRVGQPNENFARELLELFTLGDGNYSEADIKAAARAFTGWGIDRSTGRSHFRADWHDAGEKRFMGRSGKLRGDDIVSILLEQPGTAEQLVQKLWKEFISPTPDAAEVKRLGELLRRERYEMKPLLRAMFTGDAFHARQNRGVLIKSPLDLIVGTIRLLDLGAMDATSIARALDALGQLPFSPPNVKGWPGGEHWITTNTTLLRQQILRRLIDATMASSNGRRIGIAPPKPGSRRDARRERIDDDETVMMGGSDEMSGGGVKSIVRLPAALEKLDGAALRQVLVPVAPVAALDMNRPPGELAALLILDPVYQLK